MDIIQHYGAFAGPIITLGILFFMVKSHEKSVRAHWTDAQKNHREIIELWRESRDANLALIMQIKRAAAGDPDMPDAVIAKLPCPHCKKDVLQPTPESLKAQDSWIAKNIPNIR